ncbi:hypothetical protein WOLCODRAFT_28767 [Wolfiporia cocos MD-104 SS10]|uniref:Uncharacterized protein n=1 Tax=Wolfiporia cocos (strain MD-104) TaxID=742152 RepID=A0A2H3J3Q9_WOLCO|nr:hypothetical protein WOLCODRAFT_28767 [Wolfiporia cocos MD-104 SS10]
MRRILESNVSKNLREVSIIVDQPYYNQNLNELFSNKKYEKLHHVNFVFRTRPDRAIPDATRWSTLLKAAMPKLDGRGILRTHVDVHLRLFNEDDF